MFAFLDKLWGRGSAETARATRRLTARKPTAPRGLELEALEERMVLSPISDKWLSLGGASGFLGQPTTAELIAPDGVGHYQDFQGGMILWSPADGAHEVHGAILGDYLNHGAEAGPLGYPQTDEQATAVGGGRCNRFDGGEVFWSPTTGAAELQGFIWLEYVHTASETDAHGTVVQNLLGLPTSDEMDVPGMPGARMNTFQGGNIYWSTSSTNGAHVLYGATVGEYLATANETDAYGTVVQSILGLPTNDEQDVPGVAGGRMTTFQGGTIYWSPATNGAHAVYGAIGAEYVHTASETDAHGIVVHNALLLPTSDEQNVPGMPGARMMTFQGGNIYWSTSSTNGAHALYGATVGEYLATANETNAYGTVVQTILGLPTSDEMDVPGVAGARMTPFQGGTIYWSSATNGASAVYGDIGAKYDSLGGPAGYGVPISDEADVPGAPGARVTYFQGGGAIYWSANGSQIPYEVHGGIEAEYQSLGGPASPLGMPTTDETDIPGGLGRTNHFQFGTIDSSAATGTHEVHGAIYARYVSMGAEASALGLPMSDERDTAGQAGRVNTFQRGAIYWSPATGDTHEVHGAIYREYASLGLEQSSLGLPTSDEQAVPGGPDRVSYFQWGNLYWSAATDAVRVTLAFGPRSQFNFHNFDFNVDVPLVMDAYGSQAYVTIPNPFGDDIEIPTPDTLAFTAFAAAALNGDGACFGMALASLRLMHHPEMINADFGLPPGAPVSTWNLQGNGNLINYIEKQHLYQFSAEVIHYFVGWEAEAAAGALCSAGIESQLAGLLAADDPPLISLRESIGTGHAMVATGLEPGDGPNDFYIDVYDSNKPGQVGGSARIHVTAGGQWFYQMEGGSVWEGNFDTLMVLPYNVIPDTPTLPDSLDGLAGIVFGADTAPAAAAQPALRAAPATEKAGALAPSDRLFAAPPDSASRGWHGVKGADRSDEILLAAVTHRGNGGSRLTGPDAVADADLYFSSLALDADQPFAVA
jgi:uncharacterized protein with LGFP repeats